MSDAKVKEWLDKIETMSHVDCARLYRYAEPGHPVFNTTLPLYEVFMKRFNDFGGMTTSVSKDIGWRR